MAITALNRKLLRDLWRLRGQVLAVALVVASGVALLVMSLSTLTSLKETTEAYYDRYAFADVFATLKRAPDRVTPAIANIPGVQSVETRVTAFSTVGVPGVDEPVMAILLSLPDGREPTLNRFALVAGRTVAPGRADEVVLHAPFATAHGLVPGDTIDVLLNGSRRPVRVVGIALTPEFVYAIAPGGMMPDDRRFGVIWMGRSALAAAYDMTGGFNDISLTLMRGQDPEPVIDALDTILAPHGGHGAYARETQVSNWFLMNEFDQIRSISTILPTIFLAVSAFLTNAVLARLIAVERREISLMKAFGYTNLQVGWHYSALALAMAGVGVLLGWMAGTALGRYNTELYSTFFHFPFLFFRPSGLEYAISAGVALSAGLGGAILAVRNAVRLAPAQAMRPPTPESFRSTGIAEGAVRALDAPSRIIVRHVLRSPGRSLVTVTGVALAVAVLVTAMQWADSITVLVQSQFRETQRQDVTLGFATTRGAGAEHALSALPGVLAVEPFRVVSADLSHGARIHRGGLTGLPPEARQQVIRDVDGWQVPVPASGVVVGSLLAEKLDVRAGDNIRVEVLARDHPQFDVTVAGIHETYIGMPAYISLPVLNRLMGDPPSFELASLLIDEGEQDALLSSLRDLPGLSAVMIKQTAIDQMYQTLGETILIFSGFFVLFAGLLAYGVVYNAARVALSERGRELATLRVLGFSRWEVSYILIGETALLVLLALPLGCALGAGLVWVIVQSFETELFRLPFVILPPAYGKAVLVIFVASLLSALIVRRRLDRLDLIRVLKTRE